METVLEDQNLTCSFGFLRILIHLPYDYPPGGSPPYCNYTETLEEQSVFSSSTPPDRNPFHVAGCSNPKVFCVATENLPSMSFAELKFIVRLNKTLLDTTRNLMGWVQITPNLDLTVLRPVRLIGKSIFKKLLGGFIF